jgi:adenylosuccinate lyase
MGKNLNLTQGLIFSQKVLLLLCDKGLPRKQAYEIVQKNAMRSKNEKRHFMEVLLDDEIVKKYLSEQEIRDCFDIKWYLRNIDHLFDKIK